MPGKLNRVSMAARGQLAQLFAELDADESVRFVVLTGAGGAFTAGGDIAGFLEASPWEVSQLAHNVAAPERCSKPVIARLQGYVFGVGLELALACDFRIAADDVQLALPEATIGMIPGSGGTQRLARMVGLGRAKDIVMRGRRVGAEEALALGLVTAWSCRRRAGRSRHRAGRGALTPLAAGAARWQSACSNAAYDGPLHLGLELEGLAYGLLRQTHDFREGVEAFGEKRPPEFTGDVAVASRRSQASPAASTVSSFGATSCMLPIASPAQPIRFTQRRNDDSGSRISSSSTSSGGNSIPMHGLT